MKKKMTIKDSQRLVEIEKAIVLSVQEREQMKGVVKEIKGEIKEIKGDMKLVDSKLDSMMERMETKLTSMIEKMEDKFAPKRTEKALIWVITAICSGVVAGVLKVAIK